MAQDERAAVSPESGKDRANAPMTERQVQQTVLGGAERRNHERAGINRPGMLAELDSDGHPGLEVACETVDISRGGLGVRCKRMIAPGRMVRVRLIGAGGAPTALFGIVRACRYIGDGMHLVGIQFQLTTKNSNGQAA